MIVLLASFVVFVSGADSFAGFIDKKGTIVFRIPDGCVADEFSEGLVAVQKGNRWGYMDKSGQWVIPPQFKSARKFSQGLAAVFLEKEKSFVFIDKTAKGVIEVDATTVGDFHEGLAMVAKGELVGYIDRSGAFVIPQEYQFKGERYFSLGVVPVAQANPLRWCYIDRFNHPVLNKSFYGAKEVVDGLAPVCSRTGSERKELWGYLGTSGSKFAIEPQYLSAEPFSNGIACVQQGDSNEASNNYFFINERNEKLPLKFAHLSRFSEGLAAIAQLGKDGTKKYGFVDGSGKYVIEPRFDFAGNFSEGLAFISKLKPHFWGMSN